MRNPYSSYERPDENALRRQALLDALDEPTPGRTVDRTRPSMPEPAQAPGQQPGVSRPYARPTTIPDPSRADLTLNNNYTGEVIDDYAPAPSASASPTSDPFGGQFYGSQILDTYDDRYTRRGGYGGSDPKRQAVAGALLSSGNPYGMAAGAMGYLDAWLHRRAPTAPTDFNLADAQQIIRDAYKDFTGGDISEQELDQYIRGQGWEPGDHFVGEKGLSGVLDTIARKAASSAPAAAATSPGETTPPVTTPAPGTTTPGTTPTPRGLGSSNNIGFTGFDLQRAQDPTTSAKDAFAEAVSNAPPITDTSKAGAEAYFRQYIQPHMEQYGWKVLEVQGDKAFITSREKPQGGWVDYMKAAGSDNPEWAWQDADGTEGLQPVTATGGSTNSGQNLAPGVSLAPVLGQSDILQQILAEIQRIQSGAPPRDALLAELRG